MHAMMGIRFIDEGRELSFSSHPPGFEKENIEEGSTLFLSQNEPVRLYSIHTHFSLQIVILKTRENEKVEATIAIEEEEARLGK